MRENYVVVIHPDGKADFPGIDWESSPITVWHREGDYLVIKIPSGKHWESILNPSVSHPGRYLVTEIEDVLVPATSSATGSERLRVRALFEMPLSARGAKGLK
jgi:hypothetical protein